MKRFSDYEHLRCECGGVIEMYSKGEYTCANCERNTIWHSNVTGLHRTRKQDGFFQ